MLACEHQRWATDGNDSEKSLTAQLVNGTITYAIARTDAEQIAITDVGGRIITTRQIQGHKHGTFDLPIEQGVYLLKARYADGTADPLKLVNN